MKSDLKKKVGTLDVVQDPLIKKKVDTLDVVQDRLDAFLSALLNRSDSSGPEEHLGRKY